MLRSSIVALLYSLASACTAYAGKPLLVMIQDPDFNRLRQLIQDHGGHITHELPIINALGATLTQDQLDAILENAPDIARVIDDLAWEPDPDMLLQDDCALAGSLELQWNGTTASWQLFNKGSEALALEDLTIEWPAELGELKAAKFATRTLAAATTGETTARRYSLGGHKGVPAGSAATIELFFTAAPASPYGVQSQISLSASAGDDCAAKLVPSYRDPRNDSYYPTVSGAALLHSHGVTGAGVTVAVLDSGLWEDNPELTRDTQGNPRIVARYDAIENATVPLAFDDSGHGTHMTSIVARSGVTTRPAAPQPSYRGIAPDAQLVVVKAFGESGEAGFLDLVRGVQWVVDNRERLNIRVLNLSFAARPRWPYWEDPLNQALMRAWEAGIFIVAAGGNEGPDPMTIGSPGNLPYLLTVGAITDSWTETDRNDDYIPEFSSRGPTPLGHIKPDLVAPGGHMAGITRPGSSLARQFPEYFLNSGEFVMTGTSQAAALVSGLVALIVQLEPEVSNNELKCMLRTAAEPAINEDGRLAYSPFVQGEGLVNLQRALTLGRKDCDQGALDLSAELAEESHFQGPAIFSDGAPPTLPGAELLISDTAPEKGTSERRRWGVIDHLKRLDNAPAPFPFDWYAIFEEEQRRIKAITGDDNP